MRHTYIRDSILPPTVSLPRLMPDQSDRGFRQMMYDLTLVGSYIERIRGHFATTIGITAPQYNILMAVSHLGMEEGVEIGRVAQHLHVSSAFVTTEIRKLVEAGWVDKAPNPRDQRSVLLALTKKSKKTIGDLTDTIQEVNDHFFGVMSKAEFETFSDLLRRLVLSGGQTDRMAQDLLTVRARRTDE
ncbi:MAG: MarR family winged helix-turn-helix transcriptional regulator [Pseudooceanicola sp.]